MIRKLGIKNDIINNKKFYIKTIIKNNNLSSIIVQSIIDINIYNIKHNSLTKKSNLSQNNL